MGDYPVKRVELVADSGWIFGNQRVIVDNVQINNQLFTFEAN